MLKGITILNSYDIIIPEWHDTIFRIVVFSIIAVSGIALIIYILHDLKRIKEAFVPSFVMILFTLFSMVMSIYEFTHLPENKYQTRYEVTISDEVNFNEFNSRYEVVTQNGLIYTIIEKESNMHLKKEFYQYIMR